METHQQRFIFIRFIKSWYQHITLQGIDW